MLYSPHIGEESERLSDTPNVTQLIRGRAQIWTQAVWLQSSLLIHATHLPPWDKLLTPGGQLCWNCSPCFLLTLRAPAQVTSSSKSIPWPPTLTLKSIMVLQKEKEAENHLMGDELLVLTSLLLSLKTWKWDTPQPAPSFVTYYGVLGPSLNFPGSQFPHLWDGIKLESSSNKIFAESGEMMSTAEPCLAFNRLSESAVTTLVASVTFIQNFSAYMTSLYELL